MGIGVQGESRGEVAQYEDCVGQTLILNDVEFTVVGILEDDDDSLTVYRRGCLTSS